MKKIFWVLFIFICVCQTGFAKNLACEKADKKDKPFVVMYSADYCFHCKQFKPIFFHLADNLSDMYNFSYHDITTKHKPSMCDNVYLDGIPTLYVINPKTGDSVTREFTPCQLSEVVRDGYTIIVPLKTAVELASKPF